MWTWWLLWLNVMGGRFARDGISRTDTMLDPEELRRRGRRLGRPSGLSRRASAQWQLIEIAGPGAVAESAPWIDHLNAQADLSLLAGRRWLEAWVHAFRDWEPWTLTLLADDQPLAVAPLARRRARSGFDVVCIGDGQLSESPLIARDEDAVTGLVTSIAHALDNLGAPWALRLPQLPAGSPLARALQATLEPSRVVSGSPRPELAVAGRAPEQLLTANTRAAVAKARNRARREGRRLDLDWIVDWGAIRALVPEMVAIHRARDLELRGVTLLDDPAEADFYHQVLDRHSGSWRVFTVRIDGALAGYAICLMDGETLRVWDNRVAPQWRRYSAGLIANAELVLHAGADPAVRVLDWGCGAQRYKTSMSDRTVPSVSVVAWSSSLLRARRGVARLLNEHGWSPGA